MRKKKKNVKKSNKTDHEIGSTGKAQGGCEKDDQLERVDRDLYSFRESSNREFSCAI